MSFTTTTFYLTGGSLCTLVSLFMFASYFKSKRGTMLSMAFVFFWLGMRAYTFAIPTLIDPNNLNFLAFAYIVGTAMMFLIFFSGIEVQAFMARRILTPQGVNVASTIITLIAVTTLGLMIYDFRTPVINELGIIFWNVNSIAQWLIALSAFLYGLIWCYVFYKAALLLNDGYSRYRLFALSATGFLMGTVGLLVHSSSNEAQTLVGHILFIIAGIAVLSIYIVPKKFFSTGEKDVSPAL